MLDNETKFLDKEDNKYFKWYWNICDRAIDRVPPEGTYIERHHIYPKSIYGENKFLVKLTAKEHYIAHLCLWFGLREKFGKSDIKTRKMAHAFTMFNKRSKNLEGKRYNSKLYSLLKMAMSEAGKSIETRAKLSITTKNWHNFMSEEQKINRSFKISKALVGRKLSDEMREKMSKLSLNKPKSIEHNLKNSESCKGRVMSEETKRKISQTALNNGPIEKKNVYEYDLDYNLIKIWDSCGECCRFYNKRLKDVYIQKNSKMIEANNLEKLRIYNNKILTYKEIK